MSPMQAIPLPIQPILRTSTRTKAPAAKHHHVHHPEPPVRKPRNHRNSSSSGGRVAHVQQTNPAAARAHLQHMQRPVNTPPYHDVAILEQIYAGRGSPLPKTTRGQKRRHADAFDSLPARITCGTNKEEITSMSPRPPTPPQKAHRDMSCYNIGGDKEGELQVCGLKESAAVDGTLITLIPQIDS
jgi:hypothetical protein